MEARDFLNSTAAKVLLGFTIVLGAISLAKFGYLFGQWLHQFIN